MYVYITYYARVRVITITYYLCGHTYITKKKKITTKNCIRARDLTFVLACVYYYYYYYMRSLPTGRVVAFLLCSARRDGVVQKKNKK